MVSSSSKESLGSFQQVEHELDDLKQSGNFESFKELFKGETNFCNYVAQDPSKVIEKTEFSLKKEIQTFHL